MADKKIDDIHLLMYNLWQSTNTKVTTSLRILEVTALTYYLNRLITMLWPLSILAYKSPRLYSASRGPDAE